MSKKKDRKPSGRPRRSNGKNDEALEVIVEPDNVPTGRDNSRGLQKKMKGGHKKDKLEKSSGD